MSKLEVRMPVEERDRLREVASERGITVAELVRGQLAPILAVEERSAAQGAAPAADSSRIAPEPPGTAVPVSEWPPPERTGVDLVAVVAAAADIPLRLAGRRIRQGRVTVDGVPHLELEVPNPPTSVQLDGVELVSG